jgi:hypothetical protein
LWSVAGQPKALGRLVCQIKIISCELPQFLSDTLVCTGLGEIGAALGVNDKLLGCEHEFLLGIRQVAAALVGSLAAIMIWIAEISLSFAGILSFSDNTLLRAASGGMLRRTKFGGSGMRGRVLVCTPSYTIVRPCRAPASFAKAEDPR